MRKKKFWKFFWGKFIGQKREKKISGVIFSRFWRPQKIFGPHICISIHFRCKIQKKLYFEFRPLLLAHSGVCVRPVFSKPKLPGCVKLIGPWSADAGQDVCYIASLSSDNKFYYHFLHLCPFSFDARVMHACL